MSLLSLCGSYCWWQKQQGVSKTNRNSIVIFPRPYHKEQIVYTWPNDFPIWDGCLKSRVLLLSFRSCDPVNSLSLPAQCKLYIALRVLVSVNQITAVNRMSRSSQRGPSSAQVETKLIWVKMCGPERDRSDQASINLITSRETQSNGCCRLMRLGPGVYL